MRFTLKTLLMTGALYLSAISSSMPVLNDQTLNQQLIPIHPLSQPQVQEAVMQFPVVREDLYAPPTPPVRNVAEFEPSEAALIRFPPGIPAAMVKELAEDVIVYCLVTAGEQSNAQSSFQSAGVNMSNVKFINVSTDSYWTRDYGPWWIIDGTGKFGVIDFKYNRPRPLDDATTPVVATSLTVPCYDMGVTTAGGDYMTDGYGIGASTNLVIKENSTLSQAEVEKRHKDYLGLTAFLTMDDPLLGSSIDHIDCWSKFLAPDKILIKEVPQGNSDYASLEKAVTYWKGKTSCYGTPYTIYRVTGTAGNEAYTNSFICNKKVFVPTAGTANDTKALDVYKNAMPGYEVFGFSGSFQSTDAIHCRTHEMADRNMLYIKHIPLHDTVESKNGSGYPLDITLIAYSGKNIISDSLLVFYKTKDQSTFSRVTIEKVTGNHYTAVIPPTARNAELSYYIHAADESGRSENHPYIGAPDPHVFYAKTDGITGVASNGKKCAPVASTRNFPNPFSITTKIAFNLPSIGSHAKVSIYNSTGKLIRQWYLRKSTGSIDWDGKDSHGARVPTGVYVYLVAQGSVVMHGQMQFVK